MFPTIPDSVSRPYSRQIPPQYSPPVHDPVLSLVPPTNCVVPSPPVNEVCWTYSHHCQIADKNPSKRWNGEFRGFRICIGWIPQRDFLLWVFMCPINFCLYVSFVSFSGYHAPRLSLFRRPRRWLPRPIYTARAITPSAISTLPPLHGYHACVYISRISRHSLILLLGYHTRAITLHHTRTSGYHTHHSSEFVVYRSLAITPPVFLHPHHHRGATRTNLLHTLASIERVGRALLSANEEN